MNRQIFGMILAVLAFLFFYPMLLQKFYPEYKLESSSFLAPSKPETSKSNGPDQKLADVATKLSALSDDLFSKETPVVLENSTLRLSFSTEHAVIRKVELKTLRGKTGGYKEIISVDQPSMGIGRLEIGNENLKFKLIESSSQYVEFEASSSMGQPIRKRFELKGEHTISFSYQTDVAHRLLVGPNFSSPESVDHQFIEANFYMTTPKEQLKHVRGSKEGKVEESKSSPVWVATKDRHFSIVFKPEHAERFRGQVESLSDNRWKLYLTASANPSENEFLVYVGPNDFSILEPIGLGKIVNFGLWDMVAKILIALLEMLYKLTKELWVSIILFTVVLNIVLFPLNRVNYASMKTMQDIQPELKRLDEKYKGDVQKLNKEKMELFKRNKVNPMSGCLLLLVQMPIFVALYVAFCKSTIFLEQKFWWIQNLAEPDRLALPFSLPFFGNQINVLPFFVVVLMFFQQKFMMMKIPGQDPAMEMQQKIMSIMMPIILGFVFYSMPSGYVLFFVMNSLIMTAYQWYLRKSDRHKSKKPALVSN